ncbi:GTP cyclohydrolase II [Streptomyces sp. NPDC058326]|uniref:GTP cyclohydrolase II n=1 Tax=Streptomyces sp. NPDC058326 TaxID=3346447 RepID=UPI0036EE496E
MSVLDGYATTTALAPAAIRARVPIGMDRGRPVRADLISFGGLADSGEHVAVEVPTETGRIPLVRIHSECLTGDVFGSKRCDCGPQLDEGLDAVAENGGAILYLRQEGRGIGLYNKLDAYILQDTNVDTFSANRMLGRGDDERQYAVAAQMLKALGLERIRLLTNNPEKVRQLREYGIEVVDVVPTRVHSNPDNERYLWAKASLGGHNLAVS